MEINKKLSWEGLKRIASRYKNYKDYGEYFTIRNIKFENTGCIYASSFRNDTVIPLANYLPYYRIKNIVENQFETLD